VGEAAPIHAMTFVLTTVFLFVGEDVPEIWT
jgi:hypothetical protein